MTKSKNYSLNKDFRDKLEQLGKTIDNVYDEDYSLVCIQCGELIENKENVVLQRGDIYHLNCMSKVYQNELDGHML